MESVLVERPLIEALVSRGYRYVPPSEHALLRERDTEALFKPHLIAAIRHLNGVDNEVAAAVVSELSRIDDNEEWIAALRGGISWKVPGERHQRALRLVDFSTPDANEFIVTHQLRVVGLVPRKPDVVIYLNGVPVVVIEAKSPLNPTQGVFDAIDQIRSAEHDVPRLFASNLFNLATNDTNCLYAATGAPREQWARWRDPWPRAASEFATPLDAALYALLDRARLLDLLAHFLVFERETLADGAERITKKMCRYQQFRAVNKLVGRVLEGRHRQGLIWHTQGSGKSLTMVYAALKLKFHRGLEHPRLTNPNLLVLTDRRDLDRQISSTFRACGLPNPLRVGRRHRPADEPLLLSEPGPRDAEPNYALDELLVPEARGLTVLSTIHKFYEDLPGLRAKDKAAREAAVAGLAVEGSERWIVLVDECHRTQERDLGAFLRARLPHAIRFGFTGTPVRKDDLNTWRNFSVTGETYLDKYGLDDAVTDGATVPVYFTARKTEWRLYDKEIDVVFDQWFMNEPEHVIAELKRRGVTRGDLARFGPRIQLIARDIWEHYREHVAPDGFKAQLVAIDRLTCVAYKKELDAVIAEALTRDGAPPEEAAAAARAMSVCVYSPGQHDQQRDKDEGTELTVYQLDDAQEREAVDRFRDPTSPLRILIVCNKLLTGFDAPVEQVMYLDSPLTDHNLLQAIARTNRVFGPKKKRGIVVDYIGVTPKLVEALAAYRAEDVAGALRDKAALKDALAAAHRAVMPFLKGFARTDDLKADVKRFAAGLTEDRWYELRGAAKRFLDAWGDLLPDDVTLLYRHEATFLGAVLPYGRQRFEHEEERDWREYSEKIRKMLAENLEVRGLLTICKLRSLSDPAFWQDFDAEGEDEITEAAVRKGAELRRETRERVAENPARYQRFSDRVKELLAEFDRGLLAAKGLLEGLEEVARALVEEGSAHLRTGLSPRAHGLLRLIQGFGGDQALTERIDALYGSDTSAPPYWQDREGIRRELRQQVRRLALDAGLARVSDLAAAVDEHAVRGYAKP